MLRMILLLWFYIPWIAAAAVEFPEPPTAIDESTERNQQPTSNPLFNQVSLATLSDVNVIKEQMQLQYVSRVAQQMILYLSMYEKQFSRPVVAEEFQRYSQALLFNDPFICCIEYQPQQSLDLILKHDFFVAPQLVGLVLHYKYEQGVWRFVGYDQSSSKHLSDIAMSAAPYENNQPPPDESDQLQGNPENTTPEMGITINENIERAGMGVPYHLDVIYAYGIITDHCKSPIDYRTEEGKLSDINWCPAWHNVVMSP